MATKIVNNYSRFVGDVQRRAARAVTQALVLGASEAASFTPQHTSTLINSQFRDVDLHGTKVVGTVGYTAEYARAVHKASGKLKGQPRPDGKGDYWDPRGEPAFLRRGFRQAKQHIDMVIKGELKT